MCSASKSILIRSHLRHFGCDCIKSASYFHQQFQSFAVSSDSQASARISAILGSFDCAQGALQCLDLLLSLLNIRWASKSNQTTVNTFLDRSNSPIQSSMATPGQLPKPDHRAGTEGKPSTPAQVNFVLTLSRLAKRHKKLFLEPC